MEPLTTMCLFISNRFFSKRFEKKSFFFKKKDFKYNIQTSRTRRLSKTLIFEKKENNFYILLLFSTKLVYFKRFYNFIKIIELFSFFKKDWITFLNSANFLKIKHILDNLNAKLIKSGNNSEEKLFLDHYKNSFDYFLSHPHIYQVIYLLNKKNFLKNY